MSARPLVLVGEILLGVGLLLYLGAAAAAMFRVKRQYSRAMRGTFGFALSAGLAGASRHWWLGLPIVAGIILIVAGTR